MGTRTIGGGVLWVVLAVSASAPAWAANICGPVSGTLDASSNPWTVVCDASVAPADLLTVQAGVEIYFVPGTRLQVFGTLNAIGTTGQPILMQSTAAVPAPGDYATIELSGSATLAHVIQRTERAGPSPESSRWTRARSQTIWTPGGRPHCNS